MISRRSFLKAATGATAILVAPAALAKPANPAERVLRLHNLHTGESLKATYWAEGQYIAEELAAIDRVLRDHRANEITQMDRRLYDLLYTLQQQVTSKSSYQVISGYRSPITNAKLNRNSSGVAKRSLHMQGKAIDIRRRRLLSQIQFHSRRYRPAAVLVNTTRINFFMSYQLLLQASQDATSGYSRRN